MKPPFKLVPDRLSTDTVLALEELLELAKNNQVIGIAFAAMYRHREYVVNAAGECRRNPTWARGMVAALDDELRDMIQQ